MIKLTTKQSLFFFLKVAHIKPLASAHTMVNLSLTKSFSYFQDFQLKVS